MAKVTIEPLIVVLQCTDFFNLFLFVSISTNCSSYPQFWNGVWSALNSSTSKVTWMLILIAPLRMRPASRGNSRQAPWLVPHVERPWFPGPQLRRTRCPDASSKATLWVKEQHEGALTLPCIVRKHPRFPHTAPRGDWDSLSNSRGKRSSLPQTRRGLTLLPQRCRDTAVGVRNGEEAWGPVSPRDEALFDCAKPRGVPRWPTNSIASLTSKRNPGKFPQVTGRSRGKRWFPAASRERPRETFFYTPWCPSPLPGLENNDALPLATLMETWLPWRRTRGSLRTSSCLVRKAPRTPQLEETPEKPPSSRGEGMLSNIFLSG